MNLTDFAFLCFFVISLIVYYLVPRKFQWGVLLIASIAFYMAGGHPILVLYPIVSVCIVYVCTHLMTKSGRDHTKASVVDADMNASASSEQRNNSSRIASDGSNVGASRKRAILIIGVVLLLLPLLTYKYLGFLWKMIMPEAYTVSTAEASSPAWFLIVPLGLSYYTFTLISYLVDVYNGIAVPEKNLLRFMSFGMYAPALVSGPIMQYRNVSESFYAEHTFDPDMIAHGAQRMLWGFFKKLVIAERLATIVATVYDDPVTFSGRFVWLAILCFTLQLYADFSGLMDIVLGISQCLGITLPENFDTPFFSKTIAELWRRWHMTLGVWFKEYVFYPLMRTGIYARIQKSLTARMSGKKTVARRSSESTEAEQSTMTDKEAQKKAAKRAKRISTYIAMLVLWITIGLWHGADLSFVIGCGLLQWIYIVLEETLETPFKKLWERLKGDPKNKVLEALRMLRTFVLFAFSMLFFRASSMKEALQLIGCGFASASPEAIQSASAELGVAGGTGAGSVFGGFMTGLSEHGMHILNDASILGITYADIIIVIVSLIILLIVDILKTKCDVREMIAARPVVLRFIIWFALLFYVILLGCYGPGYNAADFIYQGF